MMFEEALDDRVVQVDVCVVLVAGRHAVAGNDRAVHGFGRTDQGRQNALGVNAVNPCIMQQSLGLQHIDISNLRQIGIGL